MHSTWRDLEGGGRGERGERERGREWKERERRERRRERERERGCREEKYTMLGLSCEDYLFMLTFQQVLVNWLKELV